jgi:saccharopine dehydrogenase (NAD+, L-lysine-forming)
MTTLRHFNLIYNCIALQETYNKVWFDENARFTSNITIVDISCDYSKHNNPIKLYNSATTWAKPVYKYNDFVTIIAIDNLPSLLPKESSDMFSKKCTELLLEFGSESWLKCIEKFHLAGKT